ncbi:MAG: hypothetical protein IJF19_04170 [Clostridia bacterium]|nr:hypothetical protein [Clostridia bacterium]
MKKLSFILALTLVAVFLFGCNNSGTNTPSSETVPETIGEGVSWSDNTVYKLLVGTWQIEGGETPDYYIFSEDGKIRITRGSMYFEGDVKYGIDSNGNHKLMSDFYYMSGEFNFVVKDGKAIFVDTEGVAQTFVKAEYTAPKLEVYENFNAENPLVGTWYNEEYNDTYVFNADGTAVYELMDNEKACLYHIDYTYNEADGNLKLTYNAGSGVEESSDSYKITDDTLNIIGLGEYTRK